MHPTTCHCTFIRPPSPRRTYLIDPAPTARIVGVTSNEPEDDGHTAQDWIVTGPLTVDLRADRSGTGTGRVYTIEVEATDAAGNTTRQTVSVHVLLNRD